MFIKDSTLAGSNRKRRTRLMHVQLAGLLFQACVLLLSRLCLGLFGKVHSHPLIQTTSMVNLPHCGHVNLQPPQSSWLKCQMHPNIFFGGWAKLYI